MGQVLPLAKLPREVEMRFERGPKWEEVDKTDPVAVHLARDQRARDRILEDEKIKIVREAMGQCYLQYGVNHEYKCRPLYMEYLKMIQHKNGILHVFPDDEPAQSS